MTVRQDVDALIPFSPRFTCHVHPRYKAIRKPIPGCILCHAMWQERLVWLELKGKTK